MTSVYKSRLDGPGDYIGESCELVGMSVESFATRMNMSVNEVKKLINNETPIDGRISRKLEKVFGVVSSHWMSMQRDYDELSRKPEVGGFVKVS